MLAQRPVLQINLGLSDEVIGRESIPVHDGNSKGVVKRKGGRKLKHFTKDWIQITGNVVILMCNMYTLMMYTLTITSTGSLAVGR